MPPRTGSDPNMRHARVAAAAAEQSRLSHARSATGPVVLPSREELEGLVGKKTAGGAGGDEGIVNQGEQQQEHAVHESASDSTSSPDAPASTTTSTPATLAHSSTTPSVPPHAPDSSNAPHRRPRERPTRRRPASMVVWAPPEELVQVAGDDLPRREPPPRSASPAKGVAKRSDSPVGGGKTARSGSPLGPRVGVARKEEDGKDGKDVPIPPPPTSRSVERKGGRERETKRRASTPNLSRSSPAPGDQSKTGNGTPTAVGRRASPAAEDVVASDPAPQKVTQRLIPPPRPNLGPPTTPFSSLQDLDELHPVAPPRWSPPRRPAGVEEQAVVRDGGGKVDWAPVRRTQSAGDEIHEMYDGILDGYGYGGEEEAGDGAAGEGRGARYRRGVEEEEDRLAKSWPSASAPTSTSTPPAQPWSPGRGVGGNRRRRSVASMDEYGDGDGEVSSGDADTEGDENPDFGSFIGSMAVWRTDEELSADDTSMHVRQVQHQQPPAPSPGMDPRAQSENHLGSTDSTLGRPPKRTVGREYKHASEVFAPSPPPTSTHLQDTEASYFAQRYQALEYRFGGIGELPGAPPLIRRDSSGVLSDRTLAEYPASPINWDGIAEAESTLERERAQREAGGSVGNIVRSPTMDTVRSDLMPHLLFADREFRSMEGEQVHERLWEQAQGDAPLGMQYQYSGPADKPPARPPRKRPVSTPSARGQGGEHVQDGGMHTNDGQGGGGYSNSARDRHSHYCDGTQSSIIMSSSDQRARGQGRKEPEVISSYLDISLPKSGSDLSISSLDGGSEGSNGSKSFRRKVPDPVGKAPSAPQVKLAGDAYVGGTGGVRQQPPSGPLGLPFEPISQKIPGYPPRTHKLSPSDDSGVHLPDHIRDQHAAMLQQGGTDFNLDTVQVPYHTAQYGMTQGTTGFLSPNTHLAPFDPISRGPVSTISRDRRNAIEEERDRYIFDYEESSEQQRKSNHKLAAILPGWLRR
ncbi:hypothetical protein M427DRAFT_154153 [Gonapodya prolifera JEL478]|uniref:Uncharacterized protein n=1 Tax=Gonapodya prolifera (strain JEL478) TaxID=1344416 RepID=A0A139AJR0_GONPJ|nr:hypothetical protein M427DRAFT_154153 [Gonapodya prolifera JEL478]|eukprot:KXS17046.1 hypothetical protein M427DRAFT_154153 [Gonapodya prolifera JEL478]